jgi:hypothetical protein
VGIFLRENSKNDPVNVLNSDFDPIRLSISINDPPICAFLIYMVYKMMMKISTVSFEFPCNFVSVFLCFLSGLQSDNLLYTMTKI